MDGILNIDKPAGWTSFQVVAWVRRLSGTGKVGHAGSLDPSATGVLLLCLGQAARISQYLMDLSKTYRAEIALGTATTTYDIEGEPTFRGDPSAVDEQQLRQALSQFVGEIEQAPPAYSAIKAQGRPAYLYARRGRPLTLTPRRALVYRLDLVAFAPPTLTVRVECGKGTYIRSLAHDLGQRLGCGAHLKSLVRLAIGPFTLEEACPLDKLEAAFRGGDWRGLLLPLDLGLGHLPAVTLDLEAEKDVRHGVSLREDRFALPSWGRADDGQRLRAYAEDGSFVAVLRFQASTRLWRPEKVFLKAEKDGF